jgi:hypothetical protein
MTATREWARITAPSQTIKQLENWDNELQLTEVEAGDRNDFRPTTP